MGRKTQTNNLRRILKIPLRNFPSQCIRNIGVYQESTENISSHVHRFSKSCFFSLHRLSKIRSCSTESTTGKLVHAFITSRLVYCNSILYGCPENEIKKL